MRPAGFRRRSSTLVAAVLTALVMLGAATGAAFSGNARATGGSTPTADATLAVAVDHVLSLLTDPVTVEIEGDLGQSLVGTKLVVRVEGPAATAQVSEARPELPETDKIVVDLGTPLTTSSTAGTGGAGAGVTQGAEGEGRVPGPSSTTTGPTTTTRAAGEYDEAQLAAGRLAVSVTLPPSMPEQAGAYLVVVDLKSGSDVVATGQAWIGKAAPRATPLDLAFVWPVSLGIHRDASGVFYDTVLEQALAAAGTGQPQAAGAAVPGSLRGLAGLASRFPGWNFTFSIEPILLTQLRDLSDGYTRADAAGGSIEVEASDAAAKDADTLLAAFKDAAGRDSVDVLVSPYAGADLGVLAVEGWRDGFEQIQLGKQELQQTLGLAEPLSGAYSPDLGLTSGSLPFYADASIDYVVVDASLAQMLTEPVGAGVVAVRARDENDRVTLVFADTVLGSLLTQVGDADLLFVALAAELAAAPRDAFVIAPRMQFQLMPDAYLEQIGQTLAGLDWIRTQTVGDLLRTYPPGTRPVMLRTGAASSQGYIAGALLDEIRAAHEAVADLAAIADATRTPVEAARRLLYVAESRWWWRDGTSPVEASVGLGYAVQARALAEGELAKVKLAEIDSGLIAGREGVVTLSLENGTGYELTAQVLLGGSGLTLPGGETIELELQPGRTDLPVRVLAGDGDHVLDARLVAGDTDLGHVEQSLRFITINTVLPAIVAGGILVLVGLLFLARWLLRKYGSPWAARRQRPPRRPRSGAQPGRKTAAPAPAAGSPADPPSPPE